MAPSHFKIYFILRSREILETHKNQKTEAKMSIPLLEWCSKSVMRAVFPTVMSTSHGRVMYAEQTGRADTIQ